MNKKNIIIYARNENERVKFLSSAIKDDYNVSIFTSYEAVSNKLTNDINNISLVVVDRPSRTGYSKELISLLKSMNTFMYSIPMIILTEFANNKQEIEFIGDVAIALIYYGEDPSIIKNRIERAINAMNSISFQVFSDMLAQLPFLIYLKDTEGRYVFCSQYWHHLIGSEEGWSIRGKTDLDVRTNKLNAIKAYEKDMELVKTGIGQDYIIKEASRNGGEEYCRIIKEPVSDKNGKTIGIIAAVSNVTEEENLRRELRRKSITDNLTGLYNRTFLEEFSKTFVKSDVFPITILSSDCDGLKNINDKFGHANGDKYICMAADLLKTNLPQNSTIFRMGGDEFLAVIPKTDSEEAIKIVEDLMDKASEYKTKDFCLKISVGSNTVEKPTGSVDEAIIRSDKAMYEAKKKRKSNN